MEYEGKEKSPYYGVFGSCIVLIIVPLLLYALFHFLIGKYQDLSDYLNNLTALGFGFGIGGLFHLVCIISGILKGTFKVVINRIKNFFSNLSISFKFAIKYYIEDIKEYGIVFWVYMISMVPFWVIAITSLIKFFNLYAG